MTTAARWFWSMVFRTIGYALLGATGLYGCLTVLRYHNEPGDPLIGFLLLISICFLALAPGEVSDYYHERGRYYHRKWSQPW